MKGLFYLAFAGVLLTSIPQSSAEEKNGLQVNVTKRTLNRSDRRDGLYYTRYDRTQGFKLAIKATAARPFPEGEVNWTIVVKKLYYTDRVEKYTGTEKLKALRPSEALELMVGAVPIQGYRYERDYKDEMEYDISISHAGKETMRLTSTSNFAALAKRAVLMRTPDEEAQPETTRPSNVTVTPLTPVTPTTPATPARPGIVQPTRPTTPATPVTPTTPATPATPPAPTAGNTNPTTPATPTTPADGTGKPFDFFNLGNKKPAPGN